MKRFRKRKVLICAAVLLALAVSTQFALAYFSDYEHATGQGAVNLTANTVINENATNAQKTVSIENKGDSDVLVRVAIYGPDGLTFDAGSDWTRSDDFWYYTKVLPAGKSTSEIVASITVKTSDNPNGVETTIDNLDMEIIVVHEAIPIAYEDDGTTLIKPSDWVVVPAGL